MKQHGGEAHGTYGDTGPEKPRDESDLSVSGVRGFVRDSRPCGRDEPVRPILAAGNVWHPHECFPAIRGSCAEHPSAHPLQVREAAGIPPGLAGLSYEATCV